MEPQIDLGSVNQPQLSNDVTKQRADKLTFGSGIPNDSAYSDIQNGREMEIRSQIANAMKSRNASDIANFAATAQTPLSLDEINARFNKPVSPQSVLEDNYAKEFFNYLYMPPNHFITDDNGTWQQWENSHPQDAKNVGDIAYNLKAFREMTETGLQDATAAKDNQSWLGWGVNTLEHLTQVEPEYRLRGGVPGADFALGLGTTLSNQRQALLDMNFADAKLAYRQKLEYLMKADPELAVQFAQSMRGMTDQDETLNNFMTLAAPLDLGLGVSIGKSLVKGGADVATAMWVRRMYKEMIKSPTNPERTLEVQAADGVGDLNRAGVSQIAHSMTDLPGTNPVGEAIKAFQDALKIDMSNAVSRPGNYGQEIANRIGEAYNSSIDKVTNAIINVARVERIGSVLASEKVVQAAWDEIRNNYRGPGNNIIQLNRPKYNPIDGGYSVDMILGRSDGTFFSSSQEADEFAKLNNIPISHFNDVPALRGKKTTGAYRREIATSSNVATKDVQGKGFYLAINKPLRETDNLIRDAIIETDKAKDANRGFINSLGLPAWIRTPEEVLSKQERINRLTAIYAPAILKQVLSDSMKEVRGARSRWRGGFNLPLVMKNLGKGSQFERFIDMTMKKVDPDTGLPGYQWKDIPAMDTAFRQMIGRPAEPIEVEAYFGYQRGMAMDYGFRNLALYRNMRRVGGETHTLFTTVNGNRIDSKPFVGVIHKDMPDRFSQAAPIYLMDDAGERIYMSNGIQNSSRGKAAMKGLEKGEYKLIEIYNRDLRPLSGFGTLKDENVRWVLTKNVESRPLEFTQIPRQNGGHIVYDYDHYIKQAHISVETGFRETNPFYRYEGDRTIMPISNRLMGQDLTKALNEVREHLKYSRIAEAKAAAHQLPIPWEQLKSWFYPKRGPGGELIPARLSFDEPLHVVPRNKSIKDIPNDWSTRFTDKNGSYRLRDGTTSGSLARQFQVEFTGQRDAGEVMTINNEGTRANPLYQYEPANTIDPITVLNRSMSKIVDSLWMEDYKMSSMEGWLQQAIKAGAFKESTEEIRSAPFYHFMNTKLKSGLPAQTKELLEAQRFMIKSFNGVPSNLQGWIDGVQQSLADTIYGGSNALVRGSALLGKYALATTTNAPGFLRSVAYRADIGLFSIPQFIVQNMTYVTIAGVAGWGRATEGTLGAMLHQFSRINQKPEILEAMDRIAQKLGNFKPGEWKEAREALARTGFEHVSSESNVLISHYNMEPRVVQGAWGTFLDAGDMFFKGGERNVRYGAWYTAYKDFRAIKPTGRLTNEDINEILLKADLYAGNMTKASKSALQMGPLSFPAQFLGYQMRLIELFTGKRLDMVQRARLFGTYALMYGVPVSTSAVALGLPINEQIKKYALDYGYIPGANYMSEAFMDGLPAALIHMIGGPRYNISERYGPNSLDLYRDVLAGDKPFWQIFTGASGALVTNALETMDPFFSWARSFLNNDGKYIKLTPDTIAGLLRPIASGNNALRFVSALNSGTWATRNETPIKEGVSPLNAAIMTATGLQPMEASDTRVIQQQIEDQKAAQQSYAFKFQREFRRGLQAMLNKDYDNASMYFSNADGYLTLGAYPVQKRDELFAQALQNQTLPDRLTWSYYMGREVPAGKEAQRAMIYGQIKKNERENQ